MRPDAEADDYWTLKVDVVDGAVALAVFVVVNAAGGTFVASEAERRRAAKQRAEKRARRRGAQPEAGPSSPTGS